MDFAGQEYLAETKLVDRLGLIKGNS